MLSNLERIRIEGQIYAAKHTRTNSCEGGRVCGHFRTIHGDKVWIEPFERTGHQRKNARS